MRARHRTVRLWGFTLTGSLLLVAGLCSPLAPGPVLTSASGTPTPAIAATYGKLPLSFEANQGQSDNQVKFLSRGNGYTLFLTATEAVLQLRNGKWGPGAGKSSEFGVRSSESATFRPGTLDWQLATGNWQLTPSSVLRMHLVDASPHPRMTGLEELPGKSHYFRGKDPAHWHTDIPIYAKVAYHEVYPGVDLIYYGNQHQLEYDFVIAPGADPGVIRLAFDGLVPAQDGRPQESPLQINSQGDLILQTAAGEVRLHAPRIYQEIDGSKHVIPGHYVLLTPNSELRTSETPTVGFEVAAYDTNKPLVIDPVLVYSTRFGGSYAASDLAVDAAGNAYVVGSTFSMDFPTTSGVFQPTCKPNELGSCSGDAFIIKIDVTGSSLVYSTYLGGSEYDFAVGISVDGTGNAYVTGSTQSVDFPTRTAIQPACKVDVDICRDVFVTKLNASGSALIYSTYLGGSNSFDFARGIAVDTAGSAYVTGLTGSSDFPTANALQPACGGAQCSGDMFVTKFSPAGSTFVYSTYLGGLDSDGVSDLAVDVAGNVYLTGITFSPDFPLTPGAFDTTRNTDGEMFVAKLNPVGSSLVYATYLGDGLGGGSRGIAVDASGNAYVTGAASSNLRVTPGAFDTTYNGASDAFVMKLNPTGSALVYATYLGGGSSDEGESIAVDAAGNAFVTGSTISSDFPVVNAFQQGYGGGICRALRFVYPCSDAFIAKLDTTGSVLSYSSYLGGSGDNYSDSGTAVAVNTTGNAYVMGGTSSRDFPIVSSLQQNPSDITFIAQIADAPSGVRAFFESPENALVSGVSAIRGWAFATLPGVQISSIDLFIDGQRAGDLPGLRFDSIPCCAERADVQAAFPQFPAENTLNSAWGTLFNWSLLSAGSHTVRMQIRSTTGELLVTDTRTVMVVKPGDTEFLDQFTLSGATAGIAGQEVVVEGIIVRDKATQQQKRINARLRWSIGSQSFGMVAAQTVQQLSSWQSPFPALFASLSAWWQHSPAWVASAEAGPGIMAVLENPQANQPVSGVGAIQGWAFTESGTTIRSIEFLTDEQPRGSVPCCSYRGDVAAAFPQNSNALDSGWGTPFNYGILDSGLHTLTVRVEDASGAVNTLTRAVEVVSVGGFEFVDQFDLSNATARIEGEEIALTGVRVRDKASQQSKTIDLRLRWFVNSQALGIVASSS